VQNILNNIYLCNTLAIIIYYGIYVGKVGSTFLSQNIARSLPRGSSFIKHWLGSSMLGRNGWRTEHVLKQRHNRTPSCIISAKHRRKVFTKKVYKAPQGSLSGNRRTTRDPFLGDWTAPKIIPAIITCPAIKKYAY